MADIVLILRACDATAHSSTGCYVDQGGNQRSGTFTIYIEPWHADIFEFLDLRKNHGMEEVCEWVGPNRDWPLFCPNKAPGLGKVNSAVSRLFTRRRKVVPASPFLPRIWYAILEAQIKTGGPFMVYRDHTNTKSNQKNLGTIKSSDLCMEITKYFL
ncbi:ribonucleotide reductase, alpha subunit [Laccaria bicolor S238N-H82]|uniref:Ribonucleotide reductase, alpha subunit n=1 Tax=Laccaria bicolor (strain S238N-H82 / ATCC MYA-4686) TaxID=486041 RepID=B0E2S2_LACBS|nr:ribonucleotide reductase, alpha subunit [Laccaria bicolor S238N-H82]EDQ98854.1 ribonucleotide reductase, alpha subunit [Laccaria bicolor S238N-H82]|eukprot:XP_001890489.1 ribonucleotide reductase, alpha subunit [Laccaria bicolor S238N-H82]